MGSDRRLARTPTEGVRVLWELGFFRSWKKISAVEEALAKRENHFAPAVLAKALRRAGHLTRRGKAGSYEYVQRYPYVSDDDVPPARKGGKK